MSYERVLIFVMIGMCLGIIVFQGIHGLISFVIGKSEDEEVLVFRYLFFSYSKSGGFHLGRFMPVCQLTMGKESETDEESKLHVVKVGIVQAIVCVAICAGIGWLWYTGLLFGRLLWIAVGFCLWCIISTGHWFIMMFTFFGKSKQMLFNYTKAIAQRIVANEPLDSIDIPDYTTYNCPKLTKPEIANYECFRFMKQLWDEDFDGLKLTVQSMEKALDLDYYTPKSGYLASLIAAYSYLLYYYSAVELDVKRAKYLFRMIGSDLKKDKDANSKRILAYYFCYVKEDIETAREYLREGSGSLDSMKYLAERQIEEKLLGELYSKIG